MSIGIIGCGNMGGAMAKCFFEAKFDLLIYEKSSTQQKSREKLQKFGLESCHVSLKELLEKAEIIFLAVKPQSFTDLVNELSKYKISRKIIVSIMAGVSCEKISSSLGGINREFSSFAVVRCMPNLCVQDKLGVLGWYSEKNCLANIDKQNLAKIFKTCGIAIELESEELLDKLTLISGCGPGYLAYIYNQMIENAERLGFSRENSELIVKQTIFGTTKLLEKKSPEELQIAVSSKGGVTEKIICELDEKFARIFREALEAGLEHSRKLG